MNNTHFNHLAAALSAADGFDFILKHFQHPDFLTRERVEEVVQGKGEFWRRKIVDEHESLGIAPEEYIRTMKRLLENLLEPMMELRSVLYADGQQKDKDEVTEEERGEVIEHFYQAACVLKYYLKYFEDLLAQNYLEKPPVVVDRMIYHLQLEFKRMADCCWAYSYDLQATPFYIIVEDWLHNIKNEYSQDKLKLSFDLWKQGPHPMQETVRETMAFREFLLSNKDYYAIMTQLIEAGYVDEETSQWKCTKRGAKKVAASLLKTLENSGRIRTDMPFTNEVKQRVLFNSFNLPVKQSTIAHAPTYADVKDLIAALRICS